MRSAALPLPLDVRLMNFTASVLFLGLVLGVLLACGAWVLRQPALALGRIVVEGDVQHVSAQGLLEQVVPQLTGSFVTLDLARAQQAFEQVPWVRQAQVRRAFPSSLRVQLQEHDAVAYWGLEGESTLVNSLGEVFEAGADDLEQDFLPRLIGATEDSAHMLALYQQLARVLQPLNSDIDTLEQTGRGGWRVTLDNGAVLELGSGDDATLLQRVGNLATTLPAVARQQGRRVQALEYADLRHPGGYALRLRGITTLHEPGAAPAPVSVSVSAPAASASAGSAGRAAPAPNRASVQRGRVPARQ